MSSRAPLVASIRYVPDFAVKIRKYCRPSMGRSSTSVITRSAPAADSAAAMACAMLRNRAEHAARIARRADRCAQVHHRLGKIDADHFFGPVLRKRDAKPPRTALYDDGVSSLEQEIAWS